jgi:hypothetical protein
MGKNIKLKEKKKLNHKLMKINKIEDNIKREKMKTNLKLTKKEAVQKIQIITKDVVSEHNKFNYFFLDIVICLYF